MYALSNDYPRVLGFIYPGLGVAEDDLPWLVEHLFPDGSVRAAVAESPLDEDAHTVSSLRELGQDWRLQVAADELAQQGASALIWACTSGSFVFGLEGARRQARSLEDYAGQPASSTTIAFLDAISALGFRRVAIAATYPDEVTKCFVEVLGGAGVDVLGCSSNDIPTAVDAGLVGEDDVRDLVLRGDVDGAEALLVPDTALHTVRQLSTLEAELGKPVLSANQVTVWQALRLAGAIPVPEQSGLFSRLS